MPRPTSLKSTVGRARAKLGISAEKLALRSGVGLSTIQKIERGVHVLTAETAKKLGLAMMVDPAWLLSGSVTDEPRPYAGTSWEPARANEMYLKLHNPKFWDEEMKTVAARTAAVISKAFETVALHSVVNGTIFKFEVEFQIFIKHLCENTDILDKKVATEFMRTFSED